MATLLLLWALTGGGLSSTVMMLIWLPDTTPRAKPNHRALPTKSIFGWFMGGLITKGAVCL